MSAYADPSLIVSAFTAEAVSEKAEEWFGSLGLQELVSSAWCLTETASALAAKVRARELRPTVRDMIMRQIRELIEQSARMQAISRQHFLTAAELLATSKLSLHAGDALHLAIAADAGATLWTLDRRMAEGGKALGLDVRLVR